MDAKGSGRGLPVGFLVIGTGSIAARRAAAIVATPGARLVAVHDPVGASAQAIAARHGASAAIGYASALDDDAVDAVVIATPHADHFSQVRAALEAGKHVLCEAPLALRPKQGRNLAARADELGLVLATGFPWRFAPPVRDALALVASWRLGRVEHVRVEFQRAVTPEFLAGWRGDPARSGGGVLMDGGLAACDLVRRFLGEVVAAQGSVQYRLDLAPGCESDASACFRDHDRGHAEVRASWGGRGRAGMSLTVRGTQGRLQLETAPWRLSGTLAGGCGVARAYLAERAAERLFRERNGCERSLVLELEAFVGTIKGERVSRAEASGWDGSRILDMVDAVYRSERLGVEVPVDPEPVRPFGIGRRASTTHRQVA